MGNNCWACAGGDALPHNYGTYTECQYCQRSFCNKCISCHQKGTWPMKNHKACEKFLEYTAKLGRPEWVRMREDFKPKEGCEFDENFQGLQIAVIGLSGVGKSSLINSLRGLKEITRYNRETRKVETLYPNGWVSVNHQSENLVFKTIPVGWPEDVIRREEHFRYVKLVDLPGLGTTNVPAATFVQTYGLAKYSCFIVVVDRRDNPEEVKNLVELARGHADFIIVRNKFNETCQQALSDEVLQQIPECERDATRSQVAAETLKDLRGTLETTYPGIKSYIVSAQLTEQHYPGELALLEGWIWGKAARAFQDATGRSWSDFARNGLLNYLNR